MDRSLIKYDDSVKEDMNMLKIPDVEQLHIVLLIKLSHRYVNGNLSKILCKLIDPTHIYNTRQNRYPNIRVHSSTKFNNSSLVKAPNNWLNLSQTRVYSRRMHTTHSSTHLLVGGVCLSACWNSPLGVGLETPLGMDLETSPARPSTSLLGVGP